MLWGAAESGLEVRREGDGAVRLAGRFPYNKRAVLSDGGRAGRPRKEGFASRAFAYRIDKPDEDIHLLVGHDFGKPLASRKAGTLDVRDGDDAVTFAATITPDMAEVSYVRDFLGTMRSGLVGGISPGFRIPPKRAVPNAERVEDEGHDPANGAHNAIIRTVMAALLYELSVVTRPAYDETQVEARSWETSARAEEPGTGSRFRGINRWR